MVPVARQTGNKAASWSPSSRVAACDKSRSGRTRASGSKIRATRLKRRFSSGSTRLTRSKSTKKSRTKAPRRGEDMMMLDAGTPALSSTDDEIDRLLDEAVRAQGEAHSSATTSPASSPGSDVSGPRHWTKNEDDQLRAAVDKYGPRHWKEIARHVPSRTHTQCLQRWNKVLKPGLLKGPWSIDEDHLLRHLVEQSLASLTNVNNAPKAARPELAPQQSCDSLMSLESAVTGDSEMDSAASSVTDCASTASTGDFLDASMYHQKHYGNHSREALLKRIDWVLIAENIPGRSVKQCRERWCSNLDPSIKKCEWTPEEDRVLLDTQAAQGNCWAHISRLLPGRTEHAVKTRFRSIQRARRREWSQEEDALLVQSYRQHGNQWADVAQPFKGVRTKNAVMTRVKQLQTMGVLGTMPRRPRTFRNRRYNTLASTMLPLDATRQPQGSALFREAPDTTTSSLLGVPQLLPVSIPPPPLPLGSVQGMEDAEPQQPLLSLDEASCSSKTITTASGNWGSQQLEQPTPSKLQAALSILQQQQQMGNGAALEEMFSSSFNEQLDALVSSSSTLAVSTAQQQQQQQQPGALGPVPGASKRAGRLRTFDSVMSDAESNAVQILASNTNQKRLRRNLTSGSGAPDGDNSVRDGLMSLLGGDMDLSAPAGEHLLEPKKRRIAVPSAFNL